MTAEELALLITPEGSLQSPEILSRQKLYQGRNGKWVERFWLQTPNGKTSLIFKPLTNEENVGREEWVQDHLLPKFPVECPRILASSSVLTPSGSSWAILEDAGTLHHQYDQRTLVRAAGGIPDWHSLPLHDVPESFQGHTPYIDTVLGLVTEGWDRVEEALNRSADLKPAAGQLRSAVEELNGTFPNEIVVCHGDYNFTNLAMDGDRLVVLDWEYVHRNSVFWDLYNLMDITSPRYRISPLSIDRQEILAEYLLVRKRRGLAVPLPAAEFMYRYHLYSAVYSLWILTLIEGDLQKGTFQREPLLAQHAESCEILSECIKGIS